MTSAELIDIMRETLFVTIEIALPFLLLVLIIGFLMGALQHVIHIQEMTLSFVPKMILVALALALFFPWIMKMLAKFTHNILIDQWDKIGAFTLC